jgi:hypothetical protein
VPSVLYQLRLREPSTPHHGPDGRMARPGAGAAPRLRNEWSMNQSSGIRANPIDEQREAPAQ